VSEYLSAAAEQIAPLDAACWRKRQQERFKENRVEEVLSELEPYQDPAWKGEEEAPVRACSRYLANHREQLDY